MENSERERTLQQLRAMKADYAAIQTSRSNINALKRQIQSADHDREKADDKILQEYQIIAKRKAEQIDPAKEAAQTTKHLSRKEVRKKCLPHVLLVTALALVWIVASYFVFTQQLLPGQSGLGSVMIPRMVYTLAVIISLLIHGREGDGRHRRAACIVYSIPAAITLYTSCYYADFGLLQILDVVLGGAVWFLAFRAPAPNKAYRMALKDITAKKQKMLEDIPAEAKAAYDERRYENEKSIIDLRHSISPSESSTDGLNNQIRQEKAKIAAAEKRLLNSPYLSLASLPVPPDHSGYTALKNGEVAIDHMISAIERGRADTLEEALDVWDNEVKRQIRNRAKGQAIQDLYTTEIDRLDRNSSALRAEVRDAERKQDKLEQEKERLDSLEKHLNK